MLIKKAKHLCIKLFYSCKQYWEIDGLVFFLKEETCRLPGRAKGIMLHFCYTSLLLTAINRISLLELDGCVCNLSWIHIGLDDKQLILLCPDVDTSNTILLKITTSKSLSIVTQKNQWSIFKDMPAKTMSAWPSQTHHTGTCIYWISQNFQIKKNSKFG